MTTQRHNNGGSTFVDCEDTVFTLQRKTPLQLQTLEHLYAGDKYPTQTRMEDYACALMLTYDQVKRWFIQRREREKRDAAKAQRGNGSEGSTLKSKTKTRKEKNVPNLGAGQVAYGGGRAFPSQNILPSTAFGGHHSIPDVSQAACQYEQRALKRRKVSEFGLPVSEEHSQANPVKKHGIGKGLMSVLQLVNSQASTQGTARASKVKKVLSSKSRSPAKKHGMGKGLMAILQLKNRNSEKIQGRRPQKQKSVNRQKSSKKPVMQKKRVPVRQKKQQHIQRDNQKAHRESCKLALSLSSPEEARSFFAALEDDEELEMRERQAGPNPLTCSAHFTIGGTRGCSLCKGFLPKFPPNTIGMRKPLSKHPWNSSLGLVKKLFKVFHFLYTYAVIIDVCPFTFDEFAQAFHEKNSLLLEKLHMCLIKFLLCDIDKELSNDLSIHSSKNCLFQNLLHSVQMRKFILNFWRTFLNPLTWPEILREVLVAAGFGSKDGISKKRCPNKNTDHMVKYGLTSGTLKGALFSILKEQGSKGMKVSELASSSQIMDLNLAKTVGELEDVICSTLAGDITLFEKISSSAYRLRLKFMKKDEDASSDNEECGSIDDESRDCTTLSICNSEFDSRNATSRLSSRHQFVESTTLSICTEIDESNPGESWLLGLMDGEYSDLSIEEKLNALLALVDLLSAGSSIRREDSSMALVECVPSIYQQGFGGKVKRASLRHRSLPTSSCLDVGETYGLENMHLSQDLDPVDSSVTYMILRERETCSSGTDFQHPMQCWFLGSDRRYNRYWLFLGPCNTDDPGHMRLYFESSDDGHWEVIDRGEDLYELLSALNSQGRREAVLLASLEKCIPILLDEMSNRIEVDAGVSQSGHSDISEVDRINEGSPSTISDIDNIERSHDTGTSTGAVVSDVEKINNQKQKYASLQAYDSWVWDSFYSGLHAVKHEKRSYFDSLIRCTICHDLYWRDERHCKTCHKTFEIDFDLQEKYALHIATCQCSEDADVYSTHTVLPSRLQVLKAAIHAIELVMPEDALVGAWKKSSHKLWARRLRRTSSLHELSQVLADFVGAINVDWLSQCNVALGCDSTLEDIVSCFQNMPQTTTSIALWLVKLDSLIASHLSEGRLQ